MGLLLTVVIHAANVHDSKAALGVIKSLRGRFPWLAKIITDERYRGELIEQVQKTFGWRYWKWYCGHNKPKSL